MSLAPPDLQGRLRRALEPHYAVEQELGRGAMGVVFLADDRRHDRAVAIKLLLPDLATTLGAERFLREIRTTARLQHPNILPLYDSGEADGLLYYIMPYVPGESLGSRLERDGALPPAEALRIARQVAGALAAAHEGGVLHRDVKPENILLAPDGHAWVADFGVARALSGVGGQRLTATGLLVGSPAYLSPEQIASEGEVDGRSDVYSLGCVLYEMLAGRPPYWAGSAQGILTRHLTEPVPDLLAVCPEAPAAAGEVVRRALAKDPADRPTAAELRDLLGAGFGGGAAPVPVPGREGPRPSRMRISPRRAVLAAVVVGVLGGGAVLLERGLVPVSLAALRGNEPVNSMSPAEQSIAILPFENLSGDAKNRYFIDGVVEDIQTSLSGLENLKVISRTSVASYRGDVDLRVVEKELGVEKVVMGSVRMEEGRVRVNARLVDTRTGEQLWAKRFDRELEDIFQIQSAIANEILASLRAEMTPAMKTRINEAPTGSVTAYDFYLKGRDRLRYYRAASDAHAALGNFRQALELDPGYAQAAAGLALAYLFLSEPGGPRVYADSAMSFARRAVETDPALADGYSVLGRALLGLGRVPDAREQLGLALERNPNDMIALAEMGRACMLTGRLDEALYWYKRAVVLAPSAAIYAGRVGRVYVALNDLEAAEEWFQRALRLEPDLPLANSEMMFLRLAQSRPEEARVFARARVEASPSSYSSYEIVATLSMMEGDFGAAHREFERANSMRPRGAVVPLEVAYTLMKVGEEERARPIVEWHERAAREKLRRGEALAEAQMAIARIHAIRGEREAAIRALKLAYSRGERNYHYYRGDPLLSDLRDDPEFQALLETARANAARMRENALAKGW